MTTAFRHVSTAIAVWIAAFLLGCGVGSSDEKMVLAPNANQQAVIVDYDYGKTDLSDMVALEKTLEAAIIKAKVGELDGNEVATDGSTVTLYMYGPDADALFATIEPLVRANATVKKPKFKLRYGPPQEGVREVIK